MVVNATFIGIDPSLTHTGLVVMDGQGTLLRSRAIKTKPGSTWQDLVKRQRSVVKEIELHICRAANDRSVIFIEDYAPGKFMKTVIPTVELGGLLRSMLCDLPYAVRFIAPATVKKFVTGTGNANKVAVAAALATRFGVDFGSDDNLYDAYGLARLALAVHGHTEKLTQAQIALAGKV